MRELTEIKIVKRGSLHTFLHTHPRFCAVQPRWYTEVLLLFDLFKMAKPEHTERLEEVSIVDTPRGGAEYIGKLSNGESKIWRAGSRRSARIDKQTDSSVAIEKTKQQTEEEVRTSLPVSREPNTTVPKTTKADKSGGAVKQKRSLSSSKDRPKTVLVDDSTVFEVEQIIGHRKIR